MKNLLSDPDVLELYNSLKNNKFIDVEDYLTSFPEESPSQVFNWKKSSIPEPKIFFDGIEVQDFIGDNDYGL